LELAGTPNSEQRFVKHERWVRRKQFERSNAYHWDAAANANLEITDRLVSTEYSLWRSI
jgi:hypothetical protein